MAPVESDALNQHGTVLVTVPFHGLHALFPHASFGAIVNITPHTPAGVRKPPGPCSVVNS